MVNTKPLYNNSKAKFITFEGIDGSGKSTQSQLLYNYLKSKNIQVILTREIGGIKISEKIRNIVVNSELFPLSELMLIMAARYEHIQKLILPKLQKGYIVICDRFVDSTACYQGLAKEIGIEKIYELHKKLILNLVPDITFFINIKPEIALHRISIRRINNNKFEQKSLNFYKQVSQVFHILINKFPERIVKIDANNLSIKKIHQKILHHLYSKVIKKLD